jgi:hypothetical protein
VLAADFVLEIVPTDLISVVVRVAAVAVWAVPNKLDAANTKLDDLAITVSDQGALNLRIHIEDDLADPGNHPLALFEVPEANGGHLNLVRSIVADTIAKMQATGQGVGNATGVPGGRRRNEGRR